MTGSQAAIAARWDWRGFAARPVDWLAAPIASPWVRALYVACFAILVAVRLPNILLEGRFWAEEGTVFFKNGLLLPWWRALFVSYGGYLNFTANLGGIAAAHMPALRAAPYGSTGIAFIVQCIPALLIVCSRDGWLRSRTATLAALLLVATPVVSEEVWLNAIQSQAHLALAAGIILALNAEASLIALAGPVLLLASLTSLGACALVPLFALRSVIDRSAARAIQLAFMLPGVVLQIVLYKEISSRHIEIAPSLLGAVAMIKHILLPFLGPDVAADFATPLAEQYDQHGGPLWPLLVLVALFAVGLLFTLLNREKSPTWLLLAGTVLALAGYVGSIGQKHDLLNTVAGGRYAFAPQVLFGLALLSWAVVHRGGGRIPAFGLLAWLLVVGAGNYFQPSADMFAAGPSWPEEAAAWQQDRKRPMQIWPRPWQIRLPAQAR